MNTCDVVASLSIFYSTHSFSDEHCLTILSGRCVRQTGDGCFYGYWTNPDDSIGSQEAVYVYTKYDVGTTNARRFVHFPGANTNCADASESSASSNAQLAFSYVDETDGNTLNAELWTYDAQATRWSGTNSWSTPGGESGSTTFAGFSRTEYSSEEVPRGFVCDSDLFSKVWTVTWTIGSNSCGDIVGTQRTENVEFVADGNQVKVYFQDGTSVTAARWNECQRVLDVDYDDDEDGGVTTTTDQWTFTANGASVTSTYSFNNRACSGSQSVSVAVCVNNTGLACDSLVPTSTDSLSGGAIAGIVVCVILTLGLTLLMYLHCKARTKQSRGVPAKVSYGPYMPQKDTVQHVEIVG